MQGISGATGIPVTGTFWQATQPVSGTFWQTTQPVSLASLPSLAAGSATVGSFNLLGHAGGTLDTAAGTSASTLLTVQGSASGVPIPVSMASLPAYAATPTFNLGTLGGAATNAELVTINSTLGSPFQAGGSIGNTGFNVTGTLPAFASTPTFNLGTLGGAATAANQTNGSQKTQIVDGSGNVIGSTSNNLDVQCANCERDRRRSQRGFAAVADRRSERDEPDEWLRGDPGLLQRRARLGVQPVAGGRSGTGSGLDDERPVRLDGHGRGDDVRAELHDRPDRPPLA